MSPFWITAALLVAFVSSAQADAVESLRDFVRGAKTGRAAFTQTVTSPDGKKTKTSSGNFEFSRPNRFRFAYTKPFQQLIVGDGQKVWIHDPDLNQVSSRKMSQAIGATPAALLAGTEIEKDFDLAVQPDQGGLNWVQALPKVKEGPFQSLRIGFSGKHLVVLEILDSFGQRSALRFGDMAVNAELPSETFRFVVPQGAEVLEQ